VRVIDQGAEETAGFSDAAELAYSGPFPVVAFGDHTRRVKYISEPFIAGAQGLKVIECKQVCEPKFLFYWLHIADIPDRGYSRHFQFVRKTRVPLPPLAEQRRIVAEIEKLFSGIDSAVAALRRVGQRIPHIRKAILQIATTGTFLSPPEPRDSAGARHKSLDNAPPGWRSVSWRDIGCSQNGRAFPSHEYSAEGIKLLRPGNLFADGTVKWTDANTRYLPRTWAERYPGYVVGPGELVMNLTAQSLKDEFLGRVCLTDADTECLLNQRLCRLESKEATKQFLLYLLKSPSFRRFVNGLNKGSLIQHMFTSQLDGFVFLLPPISDQQRITTDIESRLSVLGNLESTAQVGIRHAQGLRRAILQLAFAGKLVPQDPNDEPASVLLERIRAAHAQVVR
jgi:type I restriction enzyme S subunit